MSTSLEIALTILLYVVIFFVIVAGFILLAKILPKNSYELPIPEPTIWETKTVKKTYHNLTDEQVDEIMKEMDEEFQTSDGLWKTSKVTVKTVPKKKKATSATSSQQK